MELSQYLARAADTSGTITPLEWWKRNTSDLRNWAEATKKIFLLQPSSAAAERVFSVLKNSGNNKTIHYRTILNVH